MPDAGSSLLGTAALLGVGLVVAPVVWAWRRGRGPASLAPNSPGGRLTVLADQRLDYQILIGVPPERPTSWAVASRVAAGTVTMEGRGVVPLAAVTAFVVAYPNGQVVDCELAGLRGPAGMTGLSPGRNRDNDLLLPADLDEGKEHVAVKHGKSGRRPGTRGHYSTTLTNLSGRRIRVLRFAGYARTAQGWRLHTVTGAMYSAREFREWYGLGQKEWLGPGESATDPNNYGGPPMLWAYYCLAEDGTEFVAGGLLE
jgi:hypothetical protein